MEKLQVKLDERRKRFEENYYDPSNPDPFQMLDMILDEIKDSRPSQDGS